MDLELIKSDVVKASHILHQQGIAAAFGHVSARIPGTGTFIFPPRMSPALVRADNLLELDVEGNQLSGDGRPNTEFWIHARIYKARPDVQAICHVHPPSCVVLSSLGETIRPVHASGAIFRNDVQVYDRITLIRTRELGDAVASTLGDHGAMLLRGHGVNVADKDVRRVCVMTLWMEEAANYQLRAMSAGKPRYFTDEELETIYPQVSGEEVSKRVWEYFSSRLNS
jgi:ribulose-5-phosphate 4-epimerase/fuculose-1-phosphate aldolase